MSELVVPEFSSDESWPTLGPQLCDWIEDFLVFGPGDLLGLAAEIDADTRALLYRLYEVFPQWHKQAGRRRFRRGAISLRKGSAKTEKGAWIVAAELCEHAPVRCDGFDSNGEPVGIGLTDPYIPMVAYTEDQSEELAYGALKEILERSEISDEFDIGLERIMRRNGHGKAQAVAGEPNATDGARTTFQLFDEAHRLKTPKLKKAHQTMLANLPKRVAADAWSLEITTAPQPGEESVAEDTWRYAEEIAERKRKDDSLFFFHRQASDGYNMDDEEQVRKAIIEASGEAIAAWSNISGIIGLWRDPQVPRSYFERVWLNRKVQATDQVFNIPLVQELATMRKKRLPERRTYIALGFDGSKTEDSTALVGTEIDTGYQFKIGLWESPPEDSADYADWEVPAGEVDQAMDLAFDHWRVVKAYCDPFWWETYVDSWYARWPKVIVRFPTNNHKKMAYTLQSYLTAWIAREIEHDNTPEFVRHMANARKHKLTFMDDKGEELYVMRKEAKNSPLKIDMAMAGCLSWAARLDAIADGALLNRKGSKPGRTTVFMN